MNGEEGKGDMSVIAVQQDQAGSGLTLRFGCPEQWRTGFIVADV
jgi:hypothetical protein